MGLTAFPLKRTKFDIRMVFMKNYFHMGKLVKLEVFCVFNELRKLEGWIIK